MIYIGIDFEKTTIVNKSINDVILCYGIFAYRARKYCLATVFLVHLIFLSYQYLQTDLIRNKYPYVMFEYFRICMICCFVKLLFKDSW